MSKQPPCTTPTGEQAESLDYLRREAPHVLGAHIGPWKIADIGGGKVYVGHESGEGGVFAAELLLPYLEEFWREHY